MITMTDVRVADEAWIALASLHRNNPERESFSATEIMESANRERVHPERRAGLQPHVYLHNVANVAPNSATYRMFYKVANGSYRLFRPGDECHPDRQGKTAPRREELPAQYHALLDWYEKEYCRQISAPSDDQDPVLQMWGVGKEIWTEEGGDAFIASERQGWDRELETVTARKSDTLCERVWGRIVAHQGDEFHTAKGLPFTYSVDGGSGIWFYRDGNRIQKRLWRGQVDQAISMCPIGKPSDLARFMDPSYLFGLLTDPRIRDTDW